MPPMSGFRCPRPPWPFPHLPTPPLGLVPAPLGDRGGPTRFLPQYCPSVLHYGSQGPPLGSYYVNLPYC